VVIIRDILFIALRALRANKLRSALTMLGLVIGVAAVIVLVSGSQGVRNSVDAAISAAANNITIIALQPQVPGGPTARPLTESDVNYLRQAPHVALLTPTVTGSTTGAAGQIAHAVLVATPDKQFISATVTGTTANWFQTNNRQLAAGTTFTDAQVKAGAHVGVIGPQVARVLFGSSEAAVGKRVEVNYRPFTILGVMRDYGQNLNNNVVMPMAAARESVFGYGYGGDEISQITATATSTADVPLALQEITALLDKLHHISSPDRADFQVQTLGARLTTFNQVLSLLTNVTPAIAAISLLVGGIGVLNIMLVSVTDRTREIGTRKAVGASDSAVLTQFVIEAVALAGVGGVLGVILGIALIFVIRVVAPMLDKSGGVFSSFSPVLSVAPILVAFGISLAIGVIAGAYPAWRAAQLKPIEALRYE
jgi:putative ABC transport system permease protein